MRQKVRNFYSVSISGYHIAEAGANPISQLAFTLANGFTYVEYYLSRGMHIDDVRAEPVVLLLERHRPGVLGHRPRRAPHLGEGDARQVRRQRPQPEAEVPHPDVGPLAARAGDRVQRHSHDAAGALRALRQLQHRCTRTRTTRRSRRRPRRACAARSRSSSIIDKELGLSKNENPWQGSFVIEELTDLVEAAVLAEFHSLSERGGVLGAMERQYQRSKIQEESLLYEIEEARRASCRSSA